MKFLLSLENFYLLKNFLLMKHWECDLNLTIGKLRLCFNWAVGLSPFI